MLTISRLEIGLIAAVNGFDGINIRTIGKWLFEQTACSIIVLLIWPRGRISDKRKFLPQVGQVSSF